MASENRLGLVFLIASLGFYCLIYLRHARSDRGLAVGLPHSITRLVRLGPGPVRVGLLGAQAWMVAWAVASILVLVGASSSLLTLVGVTGGSFWAGAESAAAFIERRSPRSRQ